MYSPQVVKVLRILASSRSYVFEDRSDINAVEAAIDAGLCRHEIRSTASRHILREARGWSDDGVAVVFTELGRREYEKLRHTSGAP